MTCISFSGKKLTLLKNNKKQQQTFMIHEFSVLVYGSVLHYEHIKTGKYILSLTMSELIY